MKTFFPLFLFLPEVAFSSESLITETSFIFNSLLFLMGGMFALFLPAGFALLERRPGEALSRNLLILCIVTLAFWIAGYPIMYGQLTKSWWLHLFWQPEDAAALQHADFTGGYASSADWFLQTHFAALCAWIVACTLATRIALAPLLIFSGLLAGLIYPVIGSWQWGEGWLSERGFFDFAGGSLVHSLAGWCVLTALLILPESKKRPQDKISTPLLSAGIALTWVGLLALHSGAQLAFGTAADSVAVSNILVNSHLAACGGIVGAWLLRQVIKSNMPPLYAALAGLVSIAAEPLAPSPQSAIAVGFCGGMVMLAAAKGLEKIKLADTGRVISVHLCCGIWGTLAAVFTNPDATLTGQLNGILTVALAGVFVSSICWFMLQLFSRFTRETLFR